MMRQIIKLFILLEVRYIQVYVHEVFGVRHTIQRFHSACLFCTLLAIKKIIFY